MFGIEISIQNRIRNNLGNLTQGKDRNILKYCKIDNAKIKTLKSKVEVYSPDEKARRRKQIEQWSVTHKSLDTFIYIGDTSISLYT